LKRVGRACERKVRQERARRKRIAFRNDQFAGGPTIRSKRLGTLERAAVLDSATLLLVIPAKAGIHLALLQPLDS
jgi:hypothetical protein